MMRNCVLGLLIGATVAGACLQEWVAAQGPAATTPTCSLHGRWQSSDRSRSMEFVRIGQTWSGQLDTTSGNGSPEVYLEGVVGPAADGTYAGRLLTVSDQNLPPGGGQAANLSCRNQDEIVVSTPFSASTWRRAVQAPAPAAITPPQKGRGWHRLFVKG